MCGGTKWELPTTSSREKAVSRATPFMLMLFSLGHHRALVAITEQLRENEKVFAFFDDIYVVSDLGRISDVHLLLQREAFVHVRAKRCNGLPCWSIQTQYEDMEDGGELMPFVSAVHGSPSTYLWEDDLGAAHEIQQGEGGEQGDALMPLLFSLGQHRALEAIAEQLLPK